MLATITAETLAVGGCVPNTAIDIKKVDPTVEVSVFGRIGNDYKGEYVLNEMKNVGLKLQKLLLCMMYSMMIMVSLN